VYVDFELFVYHDAPEETEAPGHVCLYEFGGKRRFWTNVDCLAWAALLTQIEQQQPPSEPAPVVSTGRLAKPEGELQDVLVRAFDKTERRFHAELRVLNGGRVDRVPASASDAYILAALYRVPIFIDEKVLDAVADDGRDANRNDLV
jgi:bifunctional DNase/RNase